MTVTDRLPQRPTGAFIGASWAALLVGTSAYLVGLWNASMLLNVRDVALLERRGSVERVGEALDA